MDTATVASVEIIVSLIVSLTAFLGALSIKIINAYEQGVILRFGEFERIAMPGLTFIIPFIDSVYEKIDMRIVTTTIETEKVLTKDMVAIDVAAVTYWHVYDAKRATLGVEEYDTSLEMASQTALREMVGRSMLKDLLNDTKSIDENLLEKLKERGNEWGLSIDAVELREIKIPETLQNAMSLAAQATQEREARIIGGQTELDVAKSYSEAGIIYDKNPSAFQLRKMAVLNEIALAQNSKVILVPTDVSESLSRAIAGSASEVIKNNHL